MLLVLYCCWCLSWSVTVLLLLLLLWPHLSLFVSSLTSFLLCGSRLMKSVIKWRDLHRKQQHICYPKSSH